MARTAGAILFIDRCSRGLFQFIEGDLQEKSGGPCFNFSGIKQQFVLIISATE